MLLVDIRHLLPPSSWPISDPAYDFPPYSGVASSRPPLSPPRAVCAQPVADYCAGLRCAAAAKQAQVERGKGELDRRFEVHMAWYREEGAAAAVVEGEGDDELAQLVGQVDEQEVARACAGLFVA